MYIENKGGFQYVTIRFQYHIEHKDMIINNTGVVKWSETDLMLVIKIYNL